MLVPIVTANVITINWKTLITLAVTIGTSISILTGYQSKVDNLERRMEEVERYNPELMDYKLSQIIIIARELEEYHKTPKTSEYNDTRSD